MTTKQFIVKKEISISKDIILKKYFNLDNYIKNCIKVLYSDKIEGVEKNNYEARCIIEELQKNKEKRGTGNFNFLKNIERKTGIYIFLDNGVPVYIGKGGTGKGDDLKIRLKNECKIDGETKDKSSTLSKNIREIEIKLGNEQKVASFDNIRNIISGFQIITISSGEMGNSDNIDKTNTLETILIALFHPKYNK